MQPYSLFSHNALIHMYLEINILFPSLYRQVRVCEGHGGARKQREAALHADDVRVQLLCACSTRGFSRRQVHAATIGNYLQKQMLLEK